MAAKDNINGVQFRFEKGNARSPIGKEQRHRVVAEEGSDYVGELEWYPRGNRGISNLFVEANYRRQGIATGMWHYAHEIAKTTRGVQPPRHSADRTNDGEAWAKSVSKRLPPRRLGSGHTWEQE